MDGLASQVNLGVGHRTHKVYNGEFSLALPVKATYSLVASAWKNVFATSTMFHAFQGSPPTSSFTSMKGKCSLLVDGDVGGGRM